MIQLAKNLGIRSIIAAMAVACATSCGNVLVDSPTNFLTSSLNDFSTDIPPTDAPTAPTAAAETVISLYSDAYVDIASNTNPGSGEVVTEETIAGNPVKKSTNYIPFQLTSTIDISTKATIHLDVWSSEKPSSGSGIVVKVLDSPTEVHCTYPLASLNAGTWNSIDLALSSCTNATGSTWRTTNQSAVDQVIIDLVDDATFYVDNVYIYGTGSGLPTASCENGCTWSHQAYLKAPNDQAGDQFGKSVAIDGDTIVVGAWQEDSTETSVKNGAIGIEPGSATNTGAAYVFVRSGEAWSFQAYLKAPNAEGGDQFGKSVAINGDTIVVGAWKEDSSETNIKNGAIGTEPGTLADDSGAAYVFVRSGTAWSYQAYLKAPNAGDGDKFGEFVAIDGDTIVVGAVKEDSDQTTITNGTTVGADPGLVDASDSGAAYVFVRSGTAWSQQAYLKAPNAGNDDQFGQFVSISGDTIVVGSRKEDSSITEVKNGAIGTEPGTINNSGAAYVFVRSGTSWSYQAYLKAPNAENGDMFGQSASLSGDTIVVGAWQEDSDQTQVTVTPGGNDASSDADVGAAYVFVRSGTAWSYQAYLKAPNAGASDKFGEFVTLSENTIVVGVPYEDSDQTQIQNNITDPSSDYGSDASDGEEVGAAYVFVRSANTWAHEAYLKAPNAGVDDRFGESFAINGDTIVVGAPHEGSSQTYITNGLSASDDNSAPKSGAAYVFVGTPN